MTKTKTPARLIAFDAARYLDDDEAIAEYMTAILEANDADLLLLALSDSAAAGVAGTPPQRPAAHRSALRGAGQAIQAATRQRSSRNASSAFSAALLWRRCE